MNCPYCNNELIYSHTDAISNLSVYECISDFKKHHFTCCVGLHDKSLLLFERLAKFDPVATFAVVNKYFKNKFYFVMYESGKTTASAGPGVKIDLIMPADLSINGIDKIKKMLNFI